MESIESDIVQNDYDGLGTREARRRLAKDNYEASKEAAEIRLLTQTAALKKTREEEAARRVETRPTTTEKTPRELFIEAELKEIAQASRDHERLSAAELRACVLDFVQVFLKETLHTSLFIKLQFPTDYPNVASTCFSDHLALMFPGQAAVFVEARSKYLDAELIEKLKRAGEQEARKRIGEPQVLGVVERIRSILAVNRLAPAYADLKQVTPPLKAPFLTPSSQLRSYTEAHPGCELKSAKERSGVVSVTLREAAYFMGLQCVVPARYPAKPLEIEISGSNLPAETLSLFLTSARENARRLAELPAVATDAGAPTTRAGAGSGTDSKSELLSQTQSLATRNRVATLAADADAAREKARQKRAELEASFVSQPSLFETVEYLHTSCLKPLATGSCLICNKQLLPSDPSRVNKIPKSMTTLRLYCGHMYHFKCVEAFVSAPPFGKTCLHCGVLIQHSRLMTDVKILEQRWIHRQARQREIDDVSEFMSL